ncbi:phospholipid-binding protein MlaC [Sodalis sp. CWE]|uniref:phospholipid-binding protein MlaC n=1 Tax=Sodalis sp. CWE TaxID=2803816 RepID=UPI001C7D7FF5|nr:phospholipid-binding protein MlaC [Sodalis sp. CWE]MBX4180841.1 phospholipid-binding protein MlaC [Sodalis sp. CWE]
MLKKILIPVLLTITLIAQSTDLNNPYCLMNDVIDRTFTRLKAEKEEVHKNSNYLRVIVREELFPYMHIKYAGALVLGHYYKEATPKQKHIYFKLFQDYLEQVYGQALALYDNQIYQIESEKPLNAGAKTVIIRMSVFEKEYHMPIYFDFQWHKNNISGNWQILDIAINGASIIKTKQHEWTSLLHNKGINGLIEQLQNSTARIATMTDGLST